MAYVCWETLAIVTWSRARGWDGRGPGLLRDDGVFLMGYPNLSPKDQQKVKVGNALTKFSARVPKSFVAVFSLVFELLLKICIPQDCG